MEKPAKLNNQEVNSIHDRREFIRTMTGIVLGFSGVVVFGRLGNNLNTTDYQRSDEAPEIIATPVQQGEL